MWKTNLPPDLLASSYHEGSMPFLKKFIALILSTSPSIWYLSLQLNLLIQAKTFLCVGYEHIVDFTQGRTLPKITNFLKSTQLVSIFEMCRILSPFLLLFCREWQPDIPDIWKLVLFAHMYDNFFMVTGEK